MTNKAKKIPRFGIRKIEFDGIDEVLEINFDVDEDIERPNCGALATRMIRTTKTKGKHSFILVKNKQNGKKLSNSRRNMKV